MFQVIHRQTGEIRTVYGMSGIKFLFWNDIDGCWEYGDMENYIPAEVIR